jgi:triacylglycerol esterase/lipase EstA (alpha/beta hydrolase family)
MTPPTTDLVVVLPGILGSTLRQNGRLVWAPSAGSALRAIATFGASVRQLKLPPGIGDEHPGDGVEPAALMPDLHVLPGIWAAVKGYDRLLARLRALGYREPSLGAPAGNLIPVAYDWRLSCRYNARRLGTIIEPALKRWQEQGTPYADAQVVFVCHSMGGLIARWYIEKCGGAEITRKLITLGTPYRGAARALGQLVNGAHPGLGPFRIDLTRFARSMPSLHQLLPEYACVQQGDDLAKTTGITLPELDPAMVADAMRFYTDLHDAETRRPQSLAATHAIVGTTQATATTARLTGGRIELLDSYQDRVLYGDSTVPAVAACRPDVPMDSNTLRRIPDKHGNLQRNTAALDEVEGILTASSIIIKAAKPVPLRVDAPDFALAGEALTLRVTPAEPTRQAIGLTVTSETGTLIEARRLRPSGQSITIDGLAPGAYTIDVAGTDLASPFAPVSSDILIWESPELNLNTQ